MNLISPFGGKLINLIVEDKERARLLNFANRLPSVQLSERAVCDLELLATGAFSPLETFMNRADFESVSSKMRLANATLFPMPISLAVDDFEGLKLDAEIALRDKRNDLLGVLRVEEIYEWSKEDFARDVLKTNDFRHPLVSEIEHWGKFNLSGKLQILNLPKHFDFADLRLSPAQTREKLAELNNENVVAFQTRNPIHRAHEEMTKRAISAIGGTLLIHPVVGMTKPGDIDYLTRVRTYCALVKNYYAGEKVLLALLPLTMRMAGGREALFHALIRRNYGANHFIVGRDHASPGKGFYESDAAQKLVAEFAIPWYFQFVASWQRAEKEGRLEMMWLTYEEMIADKPATVQKILDFNGMDAPVENIKQKIAEIEADGEKNRFNKGVAGRGKVLLKETQKSRIKNLARHFPSTDFSLLGP